MINRAPFISPLCHVDDKVIFVCKSNPKLPCGTKKSGPWPLGESNNALLIDCSMSVYYIHRKNTWNRNTNQCTAMSHVLPPFWCHKNFNCSTVLNLADSHFTRLYNCQNDISLVVQQISTICETCKIKLYFTYGIPDSIMRGIKRQKNNFKQVYLLC